MMDLKQAREVLEIWGDYSYLTHRENQFVSALRAALAEVERLTVEVGRLMEPGHVVFVPKGKS